MRVSRVYRADFHPSRVPTYSEFEKLSLASDSFVCFIDEDAPRKDKELATVFATVIYTRDKNGELPVFSVQRFAQLVHQRPFYELVFAPSDHPLQQSVAKNQRLLWFRRPKELTERTKDIMFPFQIGDEFYLFDSITFDARLVVKLFAFDQKPSAATGHVIVDVRAVF